MVLALCTGIGYCYDTLQCVLLDDELRAYLKLYPEIRPLLRGRPFALTDYRTKKRYISRAIGWAFTYFAATVCCVLSSVADALCLRLHPLHLPSTLRAKTSNVKQNPKASHHLPQGTFRACQASQGAKFQALTPAFLILLPLALVVYAVFSQGAGRGISDILHRRCSSLQRHPPDVLSSRERECLDSRGVRRALQKNRGWVVSADSQHCTETVHVE